MRINTKNVDAVDQLHSNPQKREKIFEKNLRDYRMNMNHKMIPEYDEEDRDTTSYLLVVKGLLGAKPPPLIKRVEDWDKFSA